MSVALALAYVAIRASGYVALESWTGWYYTANDPHPFSDTVFETYRDPVFYAIVDASVLAWAGALTLALAAGAVRGSAMFLLGPGLCASSTRAKVRHLALRGGLLAGALYIAVGPLGQAVVESVAPSGGASDQVRYFPFLVTCQDRLEFIEIRRQADACVRSQHHACSETEGSEPHEGLPTCAELLSVQANTGPCAREWLTAFNQLRNGQPQFPYRLWLHVTFVGASLSVPLFAALWWDAREARFRIPQD